jgi:periplasmic divalent cation tolerance protein
MADAEFSIVLTSVGSQEESRRISDALVKEQLAACVQAYEMTSTYAWDDEIQHDNEILLMVKTRSDLYADVEKRISELHSYNVPEVLELPVKAGNAPYLEWVVASTRS